MRWTFQVERIGNLVSKAADKLSLKMSLGNETVGCQFSAAAFGKILNAAAPEENKAGHSYFIPAREVLTAMSNILESRLMQAAFGFDDTCLDLAKSIQFPLPRSKDDPAVADLRKRLSDVISGKVVYYKRAKRWVFRNKKNQNFALETAAKGVKKIAILDILLANGCLDSNSVLFIDFVESALHPDAVLDLLEIIDLISGKLGIQIFISSHSYFVLRKLRAIALRKRGHVKCLSLGNETSICDLYDEMPKNAIIDASVRVYEEEIQEVF